MRKMMNSGVRWIGEIPVSWNVIATKYLFQILSGATPDSSKPECWDGEINWITPADYKTSDVYVDAGRRCLSQIGFDSCSTSMIPAGNIVFSKRAPIGSVAINRTDLCTNQGCLSCVSKGNGFVKYYYYVMSVATEHYELLGSGTTFKEISATNFANFILPYPDYQTQGVISNYLDSKCARVDSLIANVQAQIEKLKAYKQSLITEVVTKGLDSTVPMKDSGLDWIGDIPEHWVVTRIKYILDNSEFGIKCGPFGSALTGKVIDDGEVIIYGQWNIVNEDFTIKRNTISEVDFDSLSSYYVQPDDVLVSMMGTIGRCAIVPQNIAAGVMDSHVIKIRLNEACVLPMFFWYEYDKNNSTVVMEHYNRKKKGFIMDGLNTSIIKNAVFILPPIEEQKNIIEYLDVKCSRIDRLVAIKQAKIEKLEQYKKSLIYEYVTGKKSVLV